VDRKSLSALRIYPSRVKLWLNMVGLTAPAISFLWGSIESVMQNGFGDIWFFALPLGFGVAAARLVRTLIRFKPVLVLGPSGVDHAKFGHIDWSDIDHVVTRGGRFPGLDIVLASKAVGRKRASYSIKLQYVPDSMSPDVLVEAMRQYRKDLPAIDAYRKTGVRRRRSDLKRSERLVPDGPG
jgi:hypothetical protein